MPETFRMVGPYGRGHRAACVPHIGELFYGEEVYLSDDKKIISFQRHGLEPIEATESALSVLFGDAFSHEKTCAHRLLSGNRCEKKPLEGGALCGFHQKIKDAEEKLAAKKTQSQEAAGRFFHGDLKKELHDAAQPEPNVAEATVDWQDDEPSLLEPDMAQNDQKSDDSSAR